MVGFSVSEPRPPPAAAGRRRAARRPARPGAAAGRRARAAARPRAPRRGLPAAAAPRPPTSPCTAPPCAVGIDDSSLILDFLWVHLPGAGIGIPKRIRVISWAPDTLPNSPGGSKLASAQMRSSSGEDCTGPEAAHLQSAMMLSASSGSGGAAAAASRACFCLSSSAVHWSCASCSRRQLCASSCLMAAKSRRRASTAGAPSCASASCRSTSSACGCNPMWSRPGTVLLTDCWALGACMDDVR